MITTQRCPIVRVPVPIPGMNWPEQSEETRAGIDSGYPGHSLLRRDVPNHLEHSHRAPVMDNGT